MLAVSSSRLKPGNLMMGADGSCTVMDLGIVKQIDEAADATASSTTGTPRYMPPKCSPTKALMVELTYTLWA